MAFHDVDEDYLGGIIGEIAQQYKISHHNTDVPDNFKYSPTQKVDLPQKPLPKECVDLKLRSKSQLETIQKHLKKFERVPVHGKTDENMLIHSVLLQLKTPPKLTSTIVRHQIAEYIATNVVFFYPKMKKYLDEKINLPFDVYVKKIYDGTIWADEYLLGAMARMLNVRITVVTPHYSDVWNVFHNSGMPDVIVISNGGDFGTKNAPTLFCATKGIQKEWNCIGHEIQVGEIGLHSKTTAGVLAAADVFSVTERRNVIRKAQHMATEIDELCADLKNLCTRRDKILEEMNGMKMDVDQIKRLSRYFVEEKQPQPQKQKHRHKKQKLSREQLEADLYEPARKRCRVKNVQQPTALPRLPSVDIPAPAEKEQDGDNITVTEKEMNKLLESTSAIFPLDINVPELIQTQNPIQTGVSTDQIPPLDLNIDEPIQDQESAQTGVSTHETPLLDVNIDKPIQGQQSAMENVITTQPRATVGQIFQRKEVSDVLSRPKLQDLPPDADPSTDVNYYGIAMTKRVAEMVEMAKTKKKQDLPTVHKSSKKQVSTTQPEISHFFREQKMQTDADVVTIEIDHDEDSVNVHGDIEIFVPETPATEQNVPIEEKTVEIKNVAIEPEDVATETVEIQSTETENETEEENIPSTSKSNIQKDVTKDDKGEANQITMPTLEEINKMKIYIPQNKDTTKVLPPIAAADRDPTHFYCELCPASYKEYRHLSQHQESLCPFVSEILVIQCPYCTGTFKLVKTFRDHMSSKHGIDPRFKCEKCGAKYNYQKSFCRHILSCKK